MNSESTNTGRQKTIRTSYASATINNRVFYIPLAYLMRVRLGTVGKALSWALIYLFPTLYYSYFLASPCTELGMFIVNYLLILFSAFGIYEMGYIYNDTIAILSEPNPTIRLYSSNFQYFSTHKRQIFAVRSTITLACLLALAAVNRLSEEILLTICAILLIAPLFLSYNICRSKLNVWLYPVLVFSRYWVFLLPYYQEPEFSLVVLMLFISFPLLNAIERFSMPRHRFPIVRRLIPDEKSKTRIRVVYYAVVVLISLVVEYSVGPQWSTWLRYMTPVILMLCYRLAIALLTHFVTPKNYLNG